MAGSSPTTGGDAGAAVVAVAKKQLGVPYSYGNDTPQAGFDCSGLVYYSYLHGAGINVGRDTVAEWSNAQSEGTIVWNSASQGTTLSNSFIKSMQPADLILWGGPGASGPNAHVQMYIGNNQIIQASGPDGTPVNIASLYPGPSIGNGETLQGVIRPLAAKGNQVTTTAYVGPYSPGSGNQSTASAPTTEFLPGYNKGIGALNPVSYYQYGKMPLHLGSNDPRSNLPFSPLFMGQSVNTKYGYTGQSFDWGGAAPMASQIVRGGISEIYMNGKKQRFGGNFKFYFMMNPQSIQYDYSFNLPNIPAQSQNPAITQYESQPMTGTQVSFTVYCNRMYEVWQGNSLGKLATGFPVPGPSEIGVRWDVRAIERLCGMFDNTNGAQGGQSYNPQSGNLPDYSPSYQTFASLPLQVVFGGPNSIAFQGWFSNLTVTYTMFAANMVPIECEIDITLQMVYLPTTGADLSTPLVQDYPATAASLNGTYPSYYTSGLQNATASPVFTGKGLPTGVTVV